MKKFNRSTFNIFQFPKSIARYQNLSFKPVPTPRPMNPYGNLDPTRKDSLVVDQYCEIRRTFNQGDEAPLAWKANRDFPDWYKPYLTNYYGHGYLIAFCAFFSLCYYLQLEETKKIKGRNELRTYSEEHNIPFIPFIRIFINLELLENNQDPFILWLRRYIRESGF